VHYRCSNKSCKANVWVNSSSNLISRMTENHDHGAYTGRQITRQEVCSSLKRKADDEPHMKPAKLIRTCINRIDNASDVLEHEDIQLLRKAAYERKRKHYPNLPKSWDEAMEQLQDSNSLNRLSAFFSDEKSVAILTNEDNLRLLQRSQHVLGDGTFECAPRHFAQLYTLRVYINKYYIPVLFCCLRDKKETTYEKLWQTIHNLCTTFCGDVPHFSYLYVDFEESCYKIVKKFHPLCTVVGCNFHLGQAWFRHIQADTDLRKLYMESKSEGGKWLRSFFGVAYLPPEEV